MYFTLLFIIFVKIFIMNIICRCKENYGDFVVKPCRIKLSRKVKKETKKSKIYLDYFIKKGGKVNLQSFCEREDFNNIKKFNKHLSFIKKYEDTIIDIIDNMDDSYLSYEKGEIVFYEEYDNGLYTNTYEIDYSFDNKSSYYCLFLETLNIYNEDIDTYSNEDIHSSLGISNFQTLIKYVDRYRKERSIRAN